MANQSLVAVFDDASTARQAENDLIQNGFNRSDIRISSNDDERVRGAGSTTDYTSSTAAVAEPTHEGGISGFFHRMFGSGSDDSTHYAEAVRRGSTVLTLTADEDRIDAATDILNRYSPVDMDQRVDDYREKGFFQNNANGGAYSGEQMTQGSVATSRTANQNTTGDRAIPVVQEEVQIGKRVVQRGGVRVYSRVTEQAVNENVTLREEHARVERRPVNRAATEADFRNGGQVVEVMETAEEPMVSKTARVVEEVVVGKDVSERQETVHDSVRRTDVQVERIDPETGQDFRRDYQKRYGNAVNADNASDADFDTYEPAYEYGYTSASNPQYRGKSWNDVESTLKTDYARNNPNSSWDRVNGAVRYGWEKVTGKR